PSVTHSDAWPLRAKRWSERLSMSWQERYTCGMMQFWPSLKSDLCTTDFTRLAGRDSREILLEEFRRSSQMDRIDAYLNADVAYYLPDALLVKVDIASMAHGLEARSPLLDHEFMEFAAALPSDLKLRGRNTKYIFKRAIRGLLPPEVIDRPKKGFSVPLDHWFRHELKEMAYDLLLDRRTLQRGYFRAGAVKQLLDEHVGGTHDWSDQLWNLLMLEFWHRTFIDSRPAVPSQMQYVEVPLEAR
ncbi:MAG: asparagine synthetase B family protein, partial [bacterium]